MALTLIHGDAHAEFTGHPIETAREALMAAADVEAVPWADLCRQFAAALPDRGPLQKGGA